MGCFLLETDIADWFIFDLQIHVYWEEPEDILNEEMSYEICNLNGEELDRQEGEANKITGLRFKFFE